MSAFEPGQRVKVVADSLHHDEWIGHLGKVHKSTSDQVFVLIDGIGGGVRAFYASEIRAVTA